MLTLYTICVHSLSQNLRSSKLDRPRRRRTWCHLTYISVMFVLGTLYTIASSWRALLPYFNNPGSAGSTVGYSDMSWSGPISRIGTASFMISNWMGDGLVLWRLSVLYHGSRYRMWVIILPSVLYLSVIGLSGFVTAHPSEVEQILYSESAAPIEIACFVLSVSLSIISTILVVTRVLLHRRKLNSVLGPGHASPYLCIAVMTIESSGLYVLWAVLYLILYVVDSPVQYVFLTSLCQIQVIAPLLIIIFVSQGKHWMRDADPNSAADSNIRFATNAVHLEMGRRGSEETLGSRAIYVVSSSPGNVGECEKRPQGPSTPPPVDDT
ncbi:hypothetical protein BV22DRAFT_1026581 [Leucogyrophana mollusca]|uniref:Uncharacterized protein n=1 Tax=Leucogyrophana mollusca TaxID=85980 RepID=A0ACB8AWI1_9AGAM|nr:hypothetical protein BV22DRAFT_1026581 [Leucogyrophana mollusca]